MTHDKNRKRAIRAEAKERGLPYQSVFEERWRPGDEPVLRRRLRSVIDVVCKGLPHYDADGGERLSALVDDLVRVAIEKAFIGVGPYREEVRGEEIGREKTEACMRLVSHFVFNRQVQPCDPAALTNALTLAIAPIVVRRCPGHRAAADGPTVAEMTSLWLDGDYENEWMPEDD